MENLSKKQLQLLKELTQLNAVSGRENEVAKYLNNVYQSMGFEIIKDQLGSIFALKKSKHPNAKKVMIVAHMDEVGFIVREIMANGCFKVQPLGGHNQETILSSRAILTTRSNKSFKGYVVALPPHLLTPELRAKKTEIKDMIFDFGFTSKAEALDQGINLGDTIVLEGTFEVLNNGKRILTKAIDDRIGLAAGIEVLQSLKDIDLDYDLYVGGSVQEEVGCRGGRTSSYGIHPDLCIVVDCSPSKDSDGNKVELGQMGSGVLIRVMDGSMIAFKDLIDFQLKTLSKAKVKYQYFISPGGTDAGQVHLQFDGIKTLTFCLCARNIHTCSTLVDAGDYLNLKKGLIYLLKHLDEKTLQRLSK